MQPPLASFKDGDEIRILVVQVVSILETIKMNHQQSVHHSSGDEDWKKFAKVFYQGKNVDIPFLYVFLMLDTVD
jgi:hypothetical protein